MSKALTERADGRYRAKYHDKYFYGSSSAEAKKKRDEYKAAQLLGIRQAPPAVTVGSYAARWLPAAKASVNSRVYNAYAGLLDVLVGAMGGRPIDQVTPTDVKSVYNLFLGKSDSTVRKAKMLYEKRCYNESADVAMNRVIAAYAYAVSEENADEHIVVTAPTCGSCGVLPAVMYYMYNDRGFPEEEILDAAVGGAGKGIIVGFPGAGKGLLGAQGAVS